jgi:hypothetical protein
MNIAAARQCRTCGDARTRDRSRFRGGSTDRWLRYLPFIVQEIFSGRWNEVLELLRRESHPASGPRGNATGEVAIDGVADRIRRYRDGTSGDQELLGQLLDQARYTECRCERRQQHEVAALLRHTRLDRCITHRAPSEAILLKFDTTEAIRRRTSWVRSRRSSKDQWR